MTRITTLEDVELLCTTNNNDKCAHDPVTNRDKDQEGGHLNVAVGKLKTLCPLKIYPKRFSRDN